MSYRILFGIKGKRLSNKTKTILSLIVCKMYLSFNCIVVYDADNLYSALAETWTEKSIDECLITK